MAVVNKKLRLNSKGETDIINITDQVAEAVENSPLTNGTVTLFISGSTAGLTTIEYEPGLVKDITRLFEELAPKKKDYAHNRTWGDGNGYSHVRASLLGPSLVIPFVNKALELGTWQQIIFIDFDNRPRSRELTLQIIGE